MSDTTDTTDTPTTDADLGEVTIVREFDASPAVIFRAFMDPNQLTHFWGPEGLSTPVDKIVIEPRVGGRFETTMVVDATGDEYPNAGVFVEFVENERWAFSEPGTGEPAMRTTTTLEDLGDGRTRLTIHQVNVPAMYRSPEALAGFNTALDKAAAYFAGLAA